MLTKKNYNKKIIVSIICFLFGIIASIATFAFCDNLKLLQSDMNKKNFDVEQCNLGCTQLLCLMYHNVIADGLKENDYEVCVSTVENDFASLKKLGYQCVDRKQLKEIAKTGEQGKFVMITFDDGFYGVCKYLPHLLQKYDFKCTMAVVGEFIDIAEKQRTKTRCSYATLDEIEQFAKSERVEIAHHTYDFHHISKSRKGIKIAKGENVKSYQNLVQKDLHKLQNKLAKINIDLKTYCYPYGEYCKQSEQVIRNNGYEMTMTCNEKINNIYGEKDLFLISRINRSAKYHNIEELLSKTCITL